MNWTIGQVKAGGRNTLKGGYWKCVLVSLIITIVSGGIGGLSGFQTSFSNKVDTYYSDDSSNLDEEIEIDIEDLLEGDTGNMNKIIEDISGSVNLGLVFAILGGIILFATVISLIITVFIITPVSIGCYKFNKEAAENEEYNIGHVGYAFSGSYLNIVKICFIMGLKVFLWTLLLIIPGIIKSYEYRMIPFILTDEPDISTKEAFELTKKMMHGNKWKSFVLDLSFIGWIILAILTLNILGIFYVYPYIYATEAHLYLTLKRGEQGYADYSSDTGYVQDNSYTSYSTDTSYSADTYASSDTANAYPDDPFTGEKGTSSVDAGTPSFDNDSDKPFNTPY